MTDHQQPARKHTHSPQGESPGIYRSLRRAVYNVLSGGSRPAESPLVRAVDFFLISLIVLNVLAVMLESVEHLSVVHGPIFHSFDDISVGIFSIEYLLRLWTAVEMPEARYRHPVWGRLRWAVTPLALFDLIAVLPFLLGLFLGEVDLNATRMLRVLRMFKLSRYSSAMNIMFAVARQEARALGATLFVMLVVVILASSLMYLAEHRAQPHVFSDIPTSMWWAVVTLTTLGYGDMVPVTPLGRLVGGLTAVVGIGMIALPAGVLASGFSEQMRIRREEYRDKLVRALDDGHLTRSERRLLDATRYRLGLSEEEAAMVLEEAVRKMGRCPNCGKVLPHTASEASGDRSNSS